MTLIIIPFILGPLENNTFLIADEASRLAAVVDPSFDSETVLQEAAHRGWQLSAVYLTHAHFDHLAGVSALVSASSELPALYLHPEDLPLYQDQGSARTFGITLDNLPAQTLPLADGQVLTLGETSIEVRHTPGHTPGHVVFYCPSAGAAFCGDLVFAGSVGRTDLPGGSSLMLIRSIRRSILSLPPATRLLCGHGPETTLREEMDSNPYF